MELGKEGGSRTRFFKKPHAGRFELHDLNRKPEAESKNGWTKRAIKDSRQACQRLCRASKGDPSRRGRKQDVEKKNGPP